MSYSPQHHGSDFAHGQKVSYLSHKTADGFRWTVEQMLTHALAGVTEQRTPATKAMSCS